MSMRRAAPGTQVSQGRLRVDAARALKKLREYQLADPAAWVLEGIRAAVASGATKIELRGDSNDIWLGWHGTPWDSELLPRLFDELVSPEVSDDKQHVRLLAAAVNSGLGMNPAYVDVYSVTAEGRAKRARFTPEVLAEPENELGDAALRHVAVEDAEPPLAITSGMLVHLRRRTSLGLLAYWIGEPPELPLARANCRDLGVPITIDGEHAPRKDLLRVPLDDGMRGFIAITEQMVAHDACFEVAERGVVLARYPLDVLGFTPKELKHEMAIRVFLDADRLPTNVARSQVRRDVHPIATAERRVRALMPTVIAKLAEAFGRADESARARRAAFSLLAAAVAGHPVGWRHVPEILEPLAELPLVRNAFGKERTITSDFVSEIYTEKTPLDPELEPWIREVLWVGPDDDVRILLAGFAIDVTSMRRHVRAARQQLKAHKRFLAHKKREIKVQTSMHPRARVSLGVKVERSMVPSDWFLDVTGEICIYDKTQNAAVVLCTEGRELERVELASKIPFDAVIDSPSLVPGERYRGVKRDAGYSRVDRAMRAGVIRALEWLVAENPPVTETDLPLIRAALVLAKDMGLEIAGPLAKQGMWRTVKGGLASYDELIASNYIGLIADAQTLEPPAGRTIVHANGEARDELRQLFGARVISYHKAVDVKPVTPERLAAMLPNAGRFACLTLQAEGLVGAISIDTKASLTLTHRGINLGTREYNFEIVRCSIVIDSDAIVPNDKWTKPLDDAKLGERSFRDWEIALVQAMAAKASGMEAPNLIAPALIEPHDPTFSVLADVLLSQTPVMVLQKPLLDRFCSWPLFRRIGQNELLSINEIADANPQGIFYVTEDMPAVDTEFLPIVASEKNAKLIGRLGKRPVHEGKAELLRRQRVAQKKQRIAEHLAKPENPARLSSEFPVAQFRGKTVRGFVGLTDLLPETRVHVEDRLFQVVHLKIGYPITAAVDLAVDQCNDSFEGISNLVCEEIIDDLERAVPDLVEAIATEKPRLFGEPGPARRLLAQFLADGQIKPELRKLLRTVAAFKTIQGEWASIEAVEDPPEYLPVAAFGDDWLPIEDGENPTPYDGPILRVAKPVDELHSIIGKLHADAVTDVTAEVLRVQARRRMARGLLPTPKLVGIPETYKKPLKAFGELTKKLGHGEVGFAMSPVSSLLIHEQGQLVRTIDVDVLPAILMAIEEPHTAYDYSQMARVAQEVAVELVRTALPSTVPAELKRNLGRAVLGRRLPPAAVGKTELFWRVDGKWIDWAAFEAQLDKYGDVWALTASQPFAQEPLDPERFVLELTSPDIELAVKNGYKIINAKVELELDAKTRSNMARSRAVHLELPTTLGVMAERPLEGDGRSSPRGRVAVLTPQHARNRGMYAHKAMHPFDVIDDVCRWPTISVVDDARITPDRTWSAPKGDDVWAAITKQVRAASEEALASIGEAPGDALAEIKITAHVCSDVKALREAPRSMIRGVVWLGAVPYTASMAISYFHADGKRNFVPGRGLAIGGQLAVFKSVDDELDIDDALDELANICHAKLVRMIMKDSDIPLDVRAAHVAHALAVKTVKPTEVSGIEFGCFAPEAIEPRQLATIFRSTDTISIVKAGTTDIAETAFVDDGSELSRVVRAHIGERLTKRGPPPKPAPPPPPTKPPVSTARPAAVVHEPELPPPVKPKPAPKPAKPHVLRPLVDALSDRVARLGIATVRWSIIPESEPMFGISDMEIRVAGDNERLRQIASAALSDVAIDALAAHVVSVLNIARQDITDATEMHALGVLLATPPSADPPRSRRSS